MSCPICRPHANARRAVHCPIGSKLFHTYEDAAEAYTTMAMHSTGGAFNAKRITDARTAMELAQQHYRAHVHDGWNPNNPEAA